MKASDWDDIVGFVAERYPDNQYTAEDAIVMFEDLKDFDASDVWSAMNHYHEEGRDFPPNASLMLARCIEERRQSARDDQYRGTHEERGKPLPESVDWSDYAVRRFGEKLDWNAAIIRIHGEMKPCGTKTCNIHYPQKVGAE